MPYGRSRFGDTLYAGESEDPTPPPPVSTSYTGSQRGTIGRGTWQAFVAARGGQLLYEIPYASLSADRVLNQSGDISVTLAVDSFSRSRCCEILNETQPYEHELVFYRNSSPEPAFVGPIINIRDKTISASDVYFWPSKRFFEEDLFRQDDGAQVFKYLLEYLMALENSAGVEVFAKECGHEYVARVIGEDKPRGTDILNSLVTSMVDFCVLGRKVYAGGLEGFFPDIPILHDRGVLSATVNKIGANFATDVAVVGGQPERFPRPVQGRAKRGTERYGLVQESYVELLLLDERDCDANALARLNAQQPLPMNVSVKYAPEAAVEFEDLVAGMKFDVRLSEVSGCIPVNQVMRSQKVGVTVDNEGEKIDGELVPQSLIDTGFIGGT